MDRRALVPREKGKGSVHASPTAREGPHSPPSRQAVATGDRTRVVIVAGQRLFREGLRLILSTGDGIEIIGEATQAPEAIDLLRDLKPDVILIDITAWESHNIEVLRMIKVHSPATKPLILTANGDEAPIFRALKAGVKGCISKDASRADLIKAVQAVHRGEVWVGRKLIADFLDEEGSARFIRKDHHGRTNTKDMLTTRERDVVRVLTSGGTNKDIAQTLSIAEKTVKCHLNNIFRKLNVARRLEVALYAIREGLR